MIEKAPEYDFGIAVFTPDDKVIYRDHSLQAPRDNVIFELGLCIGFLGRERGFVVHQKNDKPKIPTDLLGLVNATYSWPRVDGNHERAVGGATD